MKTNTTIQVTLPAVPYEFLPVLYWMCPRATGIYMIAMFLVQAMVYTVWSGVRARHNRVTYADVRYA